jgi:hypothetical protein
MNGCTLCNTYICSGKFGYGEPKKILFQNLVPIEHN